MIPRAVAAPGLRTFALVVIFATAALGGLTRWIASSNSETARPLSELLGEVKLDPAVGEIEKVLYQPFEGVKIQVAECVERVDAFPIWVTSTAMPRELDKFYPASNFWSLEVYR